MKRLRASRIPLVPLAILVMLLLLPIGSVIGAPTLNDLFSLGQGSGQTPPTLPVQHNAEPPLTATPQVPCGPGSKPEPGIQGRVPEGSAKDGLWCNLSLLAHQGHSGGFKVVRYVDPEGHECAYYDTALLLPLNALRLDGSSEGVEVLDMSDPEHPKQTATLTELPMLSPHESLNVNTRRGLLAADLGNPATYPGLVSMYDLHRDCRHPELDFTQLLARFGHESGFSPDGKTFYATGTAVQAITAIDVTDPKDPHVVWHGNEMSHGMSVGDSGDRAYVAVPAGNDHGLLILDTSEIQQRKPNPQAKEIARLAWKSVTIPQNAIPFTENGHPYLLETDEYDGAAVNPGDAAGENEVGAARIIDIADERHPQVVSNLRLQIHQPQDHAAAQDDPGAGSAVQGYAAHYCNFDTETNPKVVACSMIASGLRVFDISKITAPKEIAYFVAPPQPRIENGFSDSNYAMSKPVIVPERKEVWYTDGTTGFYALRVADSVWPKANATRSSCLRMRSFTVNLRAKGAVRRARAILGGRRLRATRSGRTIRVRVNLRRFGTRTARLVVRARLRSGRTVTLRRSYRFCG
jgi:hypothetical protein